jgi:hypothetical protein
VCGDGDLLAGTNDGANHPGAIVEPTLLVPTDGDRNQNVDGNVVRPDDAAELQRSGDEASLRGSRRSDA